MIKAYKLFFKFAGTRQFLWWKSICLELLKCIFIMANYALLLYSIKLLLDSAIDIKISILIFIALLILMIGQILLSIKSRDVQTEAVYSMCEDKRISIANKMRFMPMGYFSSHTLANLTGITTETMNELESMSLAVVSTTLVGIINSIVLSMVISIFSYKISIIYLLGIGFFLLINNKLLNLSKELAPGRVKNQMEFADSVLEFIRGMEVIRSYNLFSSSKSDISQSIKRLHIASLRIERMRVPYISLQKMVLRIMSMLAGLVSVYLYFHSDIGLIACLVLIIISFQIYSQLEDASSMFFMLPIMVTDIEKIMSIDQLPSIKSGNIKVAPINYDIRFKNVDFSYGDEKVLKNINLFAKQGSTTAIVGPSGSGKTTLANLVNRFWDVDRGEITLGDVNIKDYDVENLMSQISMVFQRVYLFRDTIEANIKFGNPEAEIQDIKEAAINAKCDHFISKLEDGYNTIIGEGGADLSGGERQRISIARAILKNAPIIILDEATANIDPENERDINTAIKNLTQDKTVIIIAHRLKTVKEADQIVVLNRGEIEQIGKHSELIQEEGLYKNFVRNIEKAKNWKI